MHASKLNTSIRKKWNESMPANSKQALSANIVRSLYSKSYKVVSITSILSLLSLSA